MLEFSFIFPAVFLMLKAYSLTARHKKAGIPFPLPAVTSLASLGTSRNWPINEAAIVLSVGRFLGHVLEFNRVTIDTFLVLKVYKSLSLELRSTRQLPKT